MAGVRFSKSVGVAFGAAATAALAWTAATSAAPAAKTTLASENAAGTGPGNGSSQNPSISANGRFVAFQSDATDLTSPASTPGNVFVRDVTAKKTRLVTRGASGAGANGDSFAPSISGNGRFVAYESAATDLLATDDTNGNDDVFVTDLKTGTTVLVSVAAGGGGVGGNDDSSAACVNANGRFIAFGSRATDLVPQSAGGSLDDVFVRDMKLGTTTLVSANTSGNSGGNGDSLFPHISSDGRFVAFSSYGDDLATIGGGNGTRVYLRDVKAGKTALVSVNQSGTASGDMGSGEPAVTPGGRFVVFDSYASDLVALKTTSSTIDVFVRDMKKGTTRLVSMNEAGTGGGDGDSFSPSISSDGRYVLFCSQATDLMQGAFTGRTQVYLRDMKKGKTTLVSVNSDLVLPSAGTAYMLGFPCFTPNGKFATFESGASDLVPGDANLANDVFVRKAR
jgi:Tol biopolymer transport system component